MNTEKNDTERMSWDNLRINDGTVEFIKWLAIAFMTIDHINSYFIFPVTGKPFVELFNIGRLAFPLFALVIAYNLARPRSSEGERQAIKSALLRLTLFGVISAIPYFLATGGRTLPLNIMFTLALATAIIYSLRIASDQEKRLHRYTLYFFIHLLFVVTAGFVEFSFYGVGLIVSAWLLFRYSSALALVFAVILTYSLHAINDTHFALLALPIFALGYFVDVKIPRMNKYLFYIYYPAHLTVIALAVGVYKLYS